MPHAEIRYSDDLTLDAPAVLAEIEEVILRHDPEAGACKGRAYPAAFSHHTHLLLALTLLKKPHRDAAFTASLMADLEAAVKAHIPQSCFFSFRLDYSDGHYVTNRHEVA
ncbi:hypothetical protein KX928_08530 [Roseobacter sp. YSTF-M11]|uniref:5-carboxymethyl-2-hydroxymuconate isomerase n=1 Tax=Roseobacter insulae TaxID=2859783 RepID=A0A9X1FVW2_9RHOB|nr:hypothetical protein [Roseobacter insulae]MBW4707828.1 hypothetical protein [Roseobacter insulae]